MRVKAISGSTGKEFEALSQQAKDLGASTSFSASEAAMGMENLASAGFSTSQIMSAMPGLLNLAASDALDLGTAADIAASTLNGFGLEASEAAHVADVLARAAADTNAGITDTGMAMKFIAPVASAMNISLEETTAAIGLLANAGIQGSSAGTVLRSALSHLAKPSKEAATLMEELGFNAYDAQGKMLPLKSIIGNLQNSMEGLTDEQKQNALVTMFGTEALSGMLALISAGPEQLEDLTNSLINSDGAAQEMAETMQDNFKGAWDEFTSAAEGAAIAVGEALLPSLTEIMGKITDLVSGFTELDPATQGLIINFGLVAAAAGPVLMTAGKLVTAFGQLMPLVDGISSVFGGSLLGSVTSLAIPLAAVGAGFYTIKEANDVMSQSVLTSREEMSWLEKVIADLTGTTTYSKEELVAMGLAYEDFNENISGDFRDAVKEMTTDIHDFGMELGQIQLDNLVSEEETAQVKERVDKMLSSCIEAIQSKNSEIQEGISKAFATDGLIDEAETNVLKYWESRGTAEKAEAEKLGQEINDIMAKASAEGRALTAEEEQAIRDKYAKIRQLELQALADNSYEIAYAQKEFQNRIKTMDGESALELMQQRQQQYQEQVIQTRSNYDALIDEVKIGYESKNIAEKAEIDKTVKMLEEARDNELKINQDKYNQDVEYAKQHCEELSQIFNKYTGERLERNEVADYQILEKTLDTYTQLQNITESGYVAIQDATTGAWKNMYVAVDEATGQILGTVDLATGEIGAQGDIQRNTLMGLEGQWAQTSEGIAASAAAMAGGYVTATGEIKKANGETVATISQLDGSITDLNGNPIEINENTADVIAKLLGVQGEVDRTNGKKANIEVTDNGTSANVQNKINSIAGKTVVVGVVYDESGKPSWNGSTIYATGTESAMSGIASVAEYGPELIVSKTGRVNLAVGRQLYNMEGGETVFNARKTKEILKGMASGNRVGSDDNSAILRQVVDRLDRLTRVVDAKEFNKITENKIEKVDVNGVTDVRGIIEEIQDYTSARML